MTGKERIIAALKIKTPDRVPLYIHGINEAPIMELPDISWKGFQNPDNSMT